MAQNTVKTNIVRDERGRKVQIVETFDDGTNQIYTKTTIVRDACGRKVQVVVTEERN